MTEAIVEEPQGVSRRALVASAGSAVPAIVAASSTPAFAASGQTVGVSTPVNQAPASGPVTATVTVRDTVGQAVAGQAVTFTGPSGSSFTPTTATTDGV
ncbi:hypothetical protein [Microbacterium sp. Leaf151]|uniref:hypothetical protein n=1 Tax=Microbacterium sp. Leaf151 TaxID=1736276 RepID=UPI00138EDE08|nr:hypothetical protein [Microbacterium sp. Leaf151]